MSKGKILKTSEYVVDENNPVILDTNILIHLFYPAINENIPKDYDALYYRIVKKGNLIISSLQLSEFINRSIRFQFGLYKNHHPDEKLDYKTDYRGSSDYNECMKAIIEIINNDISPVFSSVDDGFSSIDLEKILSVGFSFDFNDSLLCEIAKANNATVITHDADFANYTSSGITMVTENKNLLMFA